MQDFGGTKLVLLIGARLLTILRDDLVAIPWPGFWDLPGGGREGAESPEACVLREVREEVGLRLPEQALIWRKPVPSHSAPGRVSWYFAACLPEGGERDVVFGDEGQEWRLVDPDWFIGHDKAVPHFRPVVREAVLAMQALAARKTGLS